MSIVVPNLSEQIVEVVRNRILSGEVPPDLPLRQDALAAELGVSKIPLREALARLEQDGLLRSQARHGYFVRPLSTTEAEEVYALRLKLEPDATAWGCERADEEDRRVAAAMLAQLDRATKERGVSVGALNRSFHLALIRPCEQFLTINFLERLQILSERYVRKHLEQVGQDERANEEHRELLETWLSRDGDAVGALMRRHLATTLEDLRGQL